MLIVVALVVGLGAGLTAGVVLTRHSTAKRLTSILRPLGAAPLDRSDDSLDSALERLAKAVAKEQAVATSARASL